MFSVNSISAIVLFDSGALHSFISQAFVRMHSIPLCAMKNPILVNSPGGSMPASYWSPSTSISLRGGRLQSEAYCVENSGNRSYSRNGLDETTPGSDSVSGEICGRDITQWG